MTEEQPKEPLPGEEPGNNSSSENRGAGSDSYLSSTEAESEEPSISNESSSTESAMEVHHHAHHDHGKKSWKSYFWEFLMLFLAVFCGFLAEYALEHKIEHDREEQFMSSLVEDLLKDTTQMNEVIGLGRNQRSKLDSLLQLLNADEQENGFIEKVYMLQANSTRVVNMEFENRTSSQLKNAGGMRLIRQAAVVDSILRYWANTAVADNISARLERLNQVRGDISAKLFHQKYLIRNSEHPFSPIQGVRTDARLIDDNPALLAEFANRSSSRRTVLENYLRILTVMKEQATQLAKQIQQAYDLN